MYSMLDQAIPKYVEKETTNKPKYPCWYPLDLVRKIRNKNHLNKLIQKNLHQKARIDAHTDRHQTD